LKEQDRNPFALAQGYLEAGTAGKWGTGFIPFYYAIKVGIKILVWF
jgi:hypothetical protein